MKPSAVIDPENLNSSLQGRAIRRFARRMILCSEPGGQVNEHVETGPQSLGDAQRTPGLILTSLRSDLMLRGTSS